MKTSSKLTIIPLMFCFFTMGFVDLVGIASNYVKEDLNLNDATANLFPSLVFFWFLIFSVPTGMLMNKIGRKKTVLLSLVVTVVSLLLPIVGESFGIMLASFSLLGIGNASFMAPYIAMWGAIRAVPSFGMGWKVLFPIYMVIGICASIFLAGTPIDEEKPQGKASGMGECLRLLGQPIVLLSFVGIMCHVGIDVGTNTTAPKLLMERLGWTLNEAAEATSIYFIFRTIGCLTGSFFLRVMKSRTFFIISIVMMALSMVGMFVSESREMLYIAIALVGYGNSNVFSIIFSQALLALPEKKNEVSGLMIMGLFGGTVFPLLMGFASDAFGQIGAVLVMAVGVAYLFTYIGKIKM